MKRVCVYVTYCLLLLSSSFYARSQGTHPLSVGLGFSASSNKYVSPAAVSGVINDPTDPAWKYGINLDVTENSVAIPAANYTITAISSKTSIVPVANVVISKYDGYANVKIKPIAAGYSNIKLTLTKGSSTANVTINYAASDSSITPNNTYFHTGCSDASAVFSIDDSFMVVGDDEINSLFVYNRYQSGLPLKTYSYGDSLALTDGSMGNYAEIDLESGAKSPNINKRIYWMSSLANGGSSNVVKPNINRLFATQYAGTGAGTNFKIVGHYDNIRQQLINFGDAHGYNLTASSASGHDPKTIDGFNTEGMVFAPDKTTLYIAFRSPLIPTSNRTNALIAPILNFESWFNNGAPSGNPSFGAPIELNLGNRGIRDIIRLSNGNYIIIAGNYDNTPVIGGMYLWKGGTSVPQLLTTMPITALNAEAAVEIDKNGVLQEDRLQIISDNGSWVYYNDGTQSKDLSENKYKKFRSDIIVAPSNILPITFYQFNVIHSKEYNKLVWVVSNKTKGYFVVEKSDNGINFKAIQEIPITDNAEYSFNDVGVNEPVTFYRVKFVQTDQPEGIYSATQKVLNEQIIFQAKTYPNPVKGVLNVAFPYVEYDKIEMADNMGRIVFRASFNKQIQIDCSTFQSGIYSVRLISKNNEISKMISVQ